MASDLYMPFRVTLRRNEEKKILGTVEAHNRADANQRATKLAKDLGINLAEGDAILVSLKDETWEIER